MALTPEDVVNKRFQPTKFREGYDQDEVDDFLDEVVVELRRLGQENEELRQRLVASEARAASAPAAAAPTPAFAAAPAPEAFAAPQQPPYSAPAMDANPLDPNNTNNLLQLARRLHEEHVREGVEKRDALIAEGRAQAERIVQEAEQSQAARLQELEQGQAARMQELEQQQRAQLGALERERVQLEGRIDELKSFERDYRAKLKGYIEGQLRELDAVSAPPAPATGPAPTGPAPTGPAPTATTTASQQIPGVPMAAPVGYPAPAAPPAAFPGFGQG